jgi:uncharacterized membrane protein YfcA
MVGSLFVGAAFYRNLSPYLTRYWAANYLSFGSFQGFLRSVYNVVLGVYSGLFGVGPGPISTISSCSPH